MLPQTPYTHTHYIHRHTLKHKPKTYNFTTHTHTHKSAHIIDTTKIKHIHSTHNTKGTQAHKTQHNSAHAIKTHTHTNTNQKKPSH